MKHTKEKQKTEMKKVKAYAERTVTFSKRKSGILKKMSEIVSLCDAEMAFLVFSESGKPYTFANPSRTEVFGRLESPLKHEPSVSTSTKLLAESYKRRRSEELMKKYVDHVEELEVENEKENYLRKFESEKNLENVWWNISVEGFSIENLKRRHQMFLDLYVKLKAERFVKET